MEASEDFHFMMQSLRTCLPSVSADTMERWAQSMITDGITKNLSTFVEKNDLVNHGLDKYQARALANYWSGNTDIAQLRPRGNAEQDNIQQGNIQEFSIQWENVYKIKRLYNGNVYCAKTTLLEKKLRPHPKLREKIVEEVVSQVIEKMQQSATRKTFDSVYEAMARKHPSSFRETLGEGTECSGGLLHQLKTKFDNTKRPDRNTHLRNPENLQRTYEQPRGKFSYGCIKWRTRKVASGQTAETIEEQKNDLLETYRTTRSKFWNFDDINKKMSNCYKAQRDLINKNIEDVLTLEKEKRARKRRPAREDEDDPEANRNGAVTIPDIYQDWPFLFTFDGMHNHFLELTGVNLVEELDKFAGAEKEAHLKFFETLSDEEFYDKTIKRMRKAEKKYPNEDNELKAIIIMASKYFGEESFMEAVEETDTMTALDQAKRGPRYPGLLIPAKHGNLFKAKKYFVGLDSELFSTALTFRKAFMCVYMSYFVFNLNYAPHQQITLEYIQRCIFHVDPVSGHKRPLRPARGQEDGVVYSTKVVHPAVGRLHKKISSYMPNKENESTESEDSNSEGHGSDSDI